MRPFFASALATTIALIVIPAIPQRAEAGTGVLRCAMPDGSHVYTNKACSAFGAKSAPLPSDVLNRIESQQRYEAKLGGEQFDDPSLLPQVAITARRAVSSGCAATPLQLGMDLQASVAMGDVNRIAESFDWAGMRNAQAQQVMGRLQQLARNDVLDAEYFDAGFATDLAASDSIGSTPAGMMQVAFANDERARKTSDFDVSYDEGCYFLRYA